jgi:hypothetical protein
MIFVIYKGLQSHRKYISIFLLSFVYLINIWYVFFTASTVVMGSIPRVYFIAPTQRADFHSVISTLSSKSGTCAVVVVQP